MDLTYIKEALFSIGDDKASGPDGFPALFFKKAWEIVAEDVVVAIYHFFQVSKMNPVFSSTYIALIPKKPHITAMTDARPIACCSVIYKAIIKLLANRIKGFMPKLVSKCQGAFVEGRDIYSTSPRVS